MKRYIAAELRRAAEANQLSPRRVRKLYAALTQEERAAYAKATRKRQGIATDRP